jgi:hypothetical protein
MILAAALFPALASLAAPPPLPKAEGTSWEYDSTEELGGPAAGPAVHSVVTLRVGRQQFEGKELLKFETVSGGAGVKTELMMADDRGLVCIARTGKDGKLAKLNPPETIVPADLKVGATWQLEGEVGGFTLLQHFKVEAEENVIVPAGKFRAFRFHCAESDLMSFSIDRWFVPGTGFVKELTVMRGPNRGLLQRVTLELTKAPAPEVAAAKSTPAPATTPGPTPEVQLKVEPTPLPPQSVLPPNPFDDSPPPEEQPGKRLTVEVSGEPGGGSKTEFKSDVANIYVRWHGHNLPANARVRVAWVAVDVGDLVEPNFVIDETESVAPTPDASARFTLGRPPDGWAEGSYRLEFYIDDALEETVNVTIHP